MAVERQLFSKEHFWPQGLVTEVALRNRALRGYNQAEKLQGTPQQVDRALWADLFHNFSTEKLAFIALKSSIKDFRSVTISFDEQIRRRAPVKIEGISIPTQDGPMAFEWKAPKGFKLKVYPTVQDGSVKFPPMPDSTIKSAFFAANQTFPVFETVNRFSELSRVYKEKEFIHLFNKHFKDIVDLSIEVNASSAMLYASVSGLKEKIPINLASGGMNKLVAMLLIFPSQPGGVVFIDEIENGFYYKKIPLIWESILALSRAYDVQVFASTHSAECLGAAAALAADNADDFSLMRAVMDRGATRIRQISGRKFVNATEENIDLR